jgi:hypothetical protein
MPLFEDGKRIVPANLIRFAVAVSNFTYHDYSNVLELNKSNAHYPAQVASATVEHDQRRRVWFRDNGVPYLELRGTVKDNFLKPIMTEMWHGIGDTVRVYSAKGIRMEMDVSCSIDPNSNY